MIFNYIQYKLKPGLSSYVSSCYELTLCDEVDGENESEVRRGQLEDKSNGTKRASVNKDQ